MILLQRIQLDELRGHLQQVEADRHAPAVPLAPVFDAARGLGLRQLRLQRPDGSHQEFVLTAPDRHRSAADGRHATGAPRADARSGLEEALVDHRCSIEAGDFVYDATFIHGRPALPFLTAYVSLLLAGRGVRDAQILQFRLALYELCANIVEHGVVLQTPAEIGLHLALTPGGVSGWIQDNCVHFDPTRQPVGSIKDRAAARASRGYGIHMMHQLLEQFCHEFNTIGNRIHFRKRFGR